MRAPFEDVVEKVGGGAAPLWLRLEPLRFDDADELLTHLPHVAVDVSLDLHQVWGPSGMERVKSVAKLRKEYAWRPAAHRRDVARLAQMRAAGSIGWITDVALGLIKERGLNPAEVFRLERDASLHGGEAHSWGVAGHFGALLCLHGILRATFSFAGGNYNDGTVTIRGTFPHTFAAGAPGRPLAAFIEHPAFVTAGAVITAAERLDDRLVLHHEPQLVTVEEAERRWIAASSASLDQGSEEPG